MVNAQALNEEVRSFLAAYTREFSSRSGARIASLYHAPCLTVRGDGTVHSLQAPQDVERFFEGVAAVYAREGAHGEGRYKNLEVHPIGGRSVLVTVDWELRREDGSVIREWRQSYNLLRGEAGWQVLLSTFHLS
jgi:hypothetical protein